MTAVPGLGGGTGGTALGRTAARVTPRPGVAVTAVLAAAGLAAVVALTAWPGRGVLVVGVGLVQAGIVGGLAGRLHRPSALLAAAGGVAAGAAADAVLATARPASLRPLAAVLGLSLVGTLTAHVLRRERTATTSSVLSVSAVGLLAALPAVLLVARGLPVVGRDAVVVIAAGAGVAPLVAALVAALAGGAGRRALAAGLVAASGVAGLLAVPSTRLEAADGVLLGLAAATGALLVALVLVVDAAAPDSAPAGLGALARTGVLAAALPLGAGLTAGGLAARLLLG